MGEAKRRKELGLPPKSQQEKSKLNGINFSLSQFSLNNLKSQYPAAPFVATALALIALQWGLSINS